MSAITVFRTFVAATLCTALAACAMGPDFVRPQAELPGHWRGGAVAGNAIDQDAAWWAGFDDPLDRVVVDFEIEKAALQFCLSVGCVGGSDGVM